MLLPMAPTWLSSDWQMMAVPAGLGVMAGIECMEGSAMYLGDAQHEQQPRSQCSPNVLRQQSSSPSSVPFLKLVCASACAADCAMHAMRVWDMHCCRHTSTARTSTTSLTFPIYLQCLHVMRHTGQHSAAQDRKSQYSPLQCSKSLSHSLDLHRDAKLPHP